MVTVKKVAYLLFFTEIIQKIRIITNCFENFFFHICFSDKLVIFPYHIHVQFGEPFFFWIFR